MLFFPRCSPIVLSTSRYLSSKSKKSLPSLDSKDFPYLRSRGSLLVDKTGAIADLLSGVMCDNTCVFFARPRKFGKSLTLSIAAEMLAAGPLPKGVKAWPGYVAVKTTELFGGLEVHKRLLQKDTTLAGLLERPHFVVKLSLGDAQTGAKLEDVITKAIAVIAAKAFGKSLGVKVGKMPTPCGALGVLVDAVPSAVPIALLVDEYDCAIIQDVSKGRWSAADDGVAALRSLAMATKSLDFGSRIERCIITGVARFAHTSLLSGANNFVDLTGHPLLTRVLGFSEEEIRSTFPTELQRLAAERGTDEDGAVRLLAHWYNGYCFDGKDTCFNPFPVLSSLANGRITGQELEGTSSHLWLGVPSSSLLQDLAAGLAAEGATTLDIADMEEKNVKVVPLLLQTGLLSLVHGKSAAKAAQVARGGKAPPVLVAAPNEYARLTIRKVVAKMVKVDADHLTAVAESLVSALQHRDHASFQAQLHKALSCISGRTTGKAGAPNIPREAPYHTFLHGLLLAAVPQSVAVLMAEAPSAQGDADLVLVLEPTVGARGGGMHPSAVWILELGLGTKTDAKVEQAKRYAAKYAVSHDVMVCAVLVDKKKKDFYFSWVRRRAGKDSLWEGV
jgi:hypothetical protein